MSRHRKVKIVRCVMAGLTICLFSCGAGPGEREPTEEEMLGAIQAILDNYNQNLAEIEEKCRSGNYQNDPILAMQCLMLLGGSGGKGGVSAEIVDFKKIACREAQSVPGYICDYVLGIRTSGLTLPPSLAGMMGDGEVVQKRFVWTGEQWLALD